jgi:hypothetical protein
VERERRDQAEDALRDARRDRDEVGVRERLERRAPVQPPGDGLDDAAVTHGVERLAVDAEAQRFGHAEAAAMPAEQLDLTLEGPGAADEFLRRLASQQGHDASRGFRNLIALPLQHGPRKRRLVTNFEALTHLLRADPRGRTTRDN